MKKAIKNLSFVLTILLLCTSCSHFDAADAYNRIKDDGIVDLNYNIYTLGKDENEILLNITKDGKKLLNIYYTDKDKTNNYIICYNYDSSYPINKFYAEEPQDVSSYEIESQYKYSEELTAIYHDTLKEIGYSEDELLEIASYLLNKK